MKIERERERERERESVRDCHYKSEKNCLCYKEKGKEGIGGRGFERTIIKFSKRKYLSYRQVKENHSKWEDILRSTLNF